MKKPKINQADIEALIKLLTKAKKWIKAKELQWDERYLRAVASASNGQIISGNMGYKATCRATTREILDFTKRLKSQAKKMNSRVNETLTNAFA